jgi:hypothetical protein
MKIVNFQSPTGTRVGVLDADHVVDVLAAHQAQPVFAPEALPHLGHTISVIAHWQALRPGFEQAVAQSRASGAARARPATRPSPGAPASRPRPGRWQ